MADIVDTREEAEGQEQPPLIVREPLAAFLDEHGLGSGEIEAERIGEGHSNITFLIRRGDERFVLRRPPRPPLPPSAHDMLREAKLLRAMQNSPARVPPLLAVCEDEAVLGVHFYVMGYVEGTVITSDIPAALDDPAGREGIGHQLIDTLAEIHAVDWKAGGLEDFAKHTGYLDRQLRRFVGLWEHNKTRELPRVQELGDWLAQNKPESPPTTIVHGDYRLGNVMVADEPPPRIVAVFDWELSTLGDPLADVGYLTVSWAEAGDPEDTMWSSLTSVTRREGFPTRDELIARYEERTGRSVSDLRWYQTLALWKAAVFMEGNFKRFSEGASDDEYLAMFDEGVPALAEAAWEVANTRAVHVSRGLLVDFGGVLTTNVFESFRAFCEAEGLDPNEVKRLFREDPEALGELRKLERGEVTEEEFSERFAPYLGVEPEGLVDRLFAGMGPDEDMLVAVRKAKDAGVKTGLISNSWGRGRYDRSTFPELFDAVVISGEVGMNKPDPEIFHLGAERVGLSPEECVFVDDLRENCEGAEAVGMTAVLHRGAEGTVPELERLLGVALR